MKMLLSSDKTALAIAAVLDIALHAEGRPVAAKALADRHGLPPRHLEPVLQTLVHAGILNGIRGPRGGYELAREPGAITAEEIVRSVTPREEAEASSTGGLLQDVVVPVLAAAERAFSQALSQITMDNMLIEARRQLAARA